MTAITDYSLYLVSSREHSSGRDTFSVAQSAIEAGDFRADIDCNQFAFDLYSLLLGFHLYYKLLHDTETKTRQEIALERLLAAYRPPFPKP